MTEYLLALGAFVATAGAFLFLFATAMTVITIFRDHRKLR
jgi:hypothetical protein